jgi:hypothetical protein
MTSIRCSSLSIAQHCPGAPALLAATSPETDETRTGTIVHEWIRRYLETSRPDANEWLIEAGRADLFDGLQSFSDWLEETLLPQLPPVADWRTEWFKAIGLGEGLQLTGHFDVLATGCEQVIVIDWKHGFGQRWILPPIVDDLQMLGYAVLAEARGDDSVRVLRVLVSDLEYQEMILDRHDLAAARERVTAVAARVAEYPDLRTPGPHCDHCLARTACDERIAQISEVVDALIPSPAYPLTMSLDQARRWALVRGAIKDRCERLNDLLRAHLDAGAEILQDGQRLRAVGSGSRDRVIDGRGAIAELRVAIGDGADAAISTSKGAIVDALKAAGLKPAAREALIGQLRKAKAIASEPCERSMRWVKA